MYKRGEIQLHWKEFFFYFVCFDDCKGLVEKLEQLRKRRIHCLKEKLITQCALIRHDPADTS